jgi:hypothetical protein
MIIVNRHYRLEAALRELLKNKAFLMNGLFMTGPLITMAGQSAHLSVTSIATFQTHLVRMDKTDPTNYSSARINQAII